METFNFYLDTKVESWYRTPFEIEATSLEEAKEKAVALVKNGDPYLYGWDLIDETIECLTPEDNGGQSTEELFDQQGNQFWTNIESNNN